MTILRTIARMLEIATWLLAIAAVRYALWVPFMWLMLQPLAAAIGPEMAAAVILLGTFAAGHAVSFLVLEPRLSARLASREYYDAQAALWGSPGAHKHPRRSPRFEHAEHGPDTGGDQSPAPVEQARPGR